MYRNIYHIIYTPIKSVFIIVIITQNLEMKIQKLMMKLNKALLLLSIQNLELKNEQNWKPRQRKKLNEK